MINGSKKALWAAAVVVLVLASTPLQAQAVQERQVASASFYLVAVVEGNRPRGTLIPASVNISYPGTGHITVTAGGSIDEITVASTVLAVKLASLLAGRDWRLYNYTVVFQTDSGIGGPSGSVMIALVVYTMLSGSPSAGDYEGFVVTGAISPEGLASSVGGVEYKCEAAEEANITLYYPLVNTTSRLMDECSVGVPYTGLYNLTALIYGVPEPDGGSTAFTLPESFNETMAEAARRMASLAVDLVENASSLGAPDDAVGSVREMVNRSLSIVDSHPYASASLAFTSLLQAYRLYYYTLAVGSESVDEARRMLDREAERIESELSFIESQLAGMESNGSVYYVEFLATAYTRLAAARASLYSYYNYSEDSAYLLDYAVPELAHAAARIYSIREWIHSANASRLDRPVLSDRDVERLSIVVSDYVSSSAAYAKSLAEYIVETYGRSKDILVYTGIIDSLLSKAEEYMNESNYVAAIGFYREVLSQSLSMMFKSSLSIYGGPLEIYDDYYNELVVVYSLASSNLLARGLTPGLAPAYYDYSLVLWGNGDRSSALQMMEEAVVSALVWSMLALSTGWSGTGTVEVVTPPPGATPTATVVAVALAAFAVGFAFSAWMASRILRDTLYRA